VSFDPYLYVAFGLGLGAGWIVRPKGPWPDRATLGSVFLLVGLLGASLAGVPLATLAEGLPFALGFAGLILALTAVVAIALARRPTGGTAPPPPPPAPGRFPVSVALLAALFVGFGVGHAVAWSYAAAIPWALCLLLALVAFGLHLAWKGVPRVWAPITAAVLGAVGAAAVVTAVTGTRLATSLGISLAFGWYTLAGPLVAERAGAALGFVAFLTNFLRENVTMLISPAVGRRLRGEGLTALGGATSMDTTLYFVTRYGEAEAASLALASGLALTVVASLVLPAVLAL
jgi:uncharacterized membrane protein YbjE (DUF340 family)